MLCKKKNQVWVGGASGGVGAELLPILFISRNLSLFVQWGGKEEFHRSFLSNVNPLCCNLIKQQLMPLACYHNIDINTNTVKIIFESNMIYTIA